MPDGNAAATDFLPTAPLSNLELRAKLLRHMREFFDGRGFLEVETPVLSADTVLDRHLDPLRVTLFDDPRQPDVGRTLWLQTSPEFGMKRLLAAGATAIYQVARVFRGGERGAWHNPEFTMVEWYRVGDGMQEGIQLLSDLAEHVLGLGSAERLSYRQAFLMYVDLDPLEASGDQLAEAARRLGVAVPDGTRRRRPRCVAGPVVGRMRPAALGPRPPDDPVRLSGQPGGVGSRPRRRPAGGRTL